MRQDLHLLHLGQRPAAGRAPPAVQELHLRGVHPGAADRARARIPRGRGPRPARLERRPRPDDHRAHGRDPGPDDGRPLAAPGRRRTRPPAPAARSSSRATVNGGSAACAAAHWSTSTTRPTRPRAVRPRQPTRSSSRTCDASPAFAAMRASCRRRLEQLPGVRGRRLPLGPAAQAAPISSSIWPSSPRPGRACRSSGGCRPPSLDPSVVVEAQQVDPVELLVADAGAEGEGRGVAGLGVVGVAEVLEDRTTAPSRPATASRPS